MPQLPVAIDPTTLATQLRLHLHRDIGYLAGDPHLKHLQNLCRLALQPTTPEGIPAKPFEELHPLHCQQPLNQTISLE